MLSGQGRRLNGINQVGLLRTLGLIKRYELLVGFEVHFSRLIAFDFALIFQGPQQPWGVRTCGLPSVGEIRVRLGKQPSKRSLDGSIFLSVGLLHIRLGDQVDCGLCSRQRHIRHGDGVDRFSNSIFRGDRLKRWEPRSNLGIGAGQYDLRALSGIRLIGHKSIRLIACEQTKAFLHTSQHHFIESKTL